MSQIVPTLKKNLMSDLKQILKFNYLQQCMRIKLKWFFFIKKGCTVYTVGALSKKIENKMIYICMYIVSG